MLPPRSLPRRRSRRFLSAGLALVVMVVSVVAEPVTGVADAVVSPHVKLVSTRPGASEPGPGASRHPNVSADGMAVGYVTDNDYGADGTYVPGPHVVVTLSRDEGALQSDDSFHFMVDPAMSQIADPADVVVSGDGRYVAFTARRRVNDPASGRSVYTADLTTGMIARVDPDDTLVTGAPAISDDGETVVYDAAPAANPDARQIRAWDRTRRTNTVLSRRGGADGNGPSSRPAISGDGRVVAFTTSATNLVPGMVTQPRHAAGGTEAVVLERSTGAISLISNLAGGTNGTAPTGDSWIPGPDALSTDGNFVVFATDATVDLFDATIDADTNDATDVVLKIRDQNFFAVASRRHGGNRTCTGESPWATVDHMASVTFATTCTDLGVGSPDVGAGVYKTAYDQLEQVTWDNDYQGADLALLHPSTSASGDAVAWSTNVDRHSEMFGGDPNGVADVYLRVDPRSKPDITPSQPTPSEIRLACPDTTRSVVVAYPDTSNPTFDPGPAIVDAPELGAAFTVSYDPHATSPRLDLDPGLEPGRRDWDATDAARALVLEFDDGTGGSEYLVWDGGAEGFKQHVDRLWYDTYPVNVAVCMPARAAYGPKAFPDRATAARGTTVTLDVLANDEGDLDRSSLTVVSTSGGSATVSRDDGLPVVAYTAPDDAGTYTVDYEITDYGGTTVAGIATVAVGDVTDHPLTLSVEDRWISGSTPTRLGVEAHNDTGGPVDGARISLRVERPATIDGGGSGWSCTRSTDRRGITCVTAESVDDGADFTRLPVTVTTPVGPQQLCEADDPDRYCVILYAWNGERAAEHTATPDRIRAPLGYQGGTLQAWVSLEGSLHSGSPGTYEVTVGNGGGASLPVGSVFEVRSGQPDMPFLGADGDRFDCVADPDDPQRGICTSNTAIAPEDGDTLSVLFQVGEGQTAGCPAGASPCALLDVAWIDRPDATIRIPLANRADPIEGSVDPNLPDLTVQLTAPAVTWQGTNVALRAMAANAGLGPTTGPVTAEVALPAGFVPVGVTAPGWDCVLDETTVCTRTAVLAAGAHTPVITVIAGVATDASDGTVEATVATPSDANPANDTMGRHLRVLNGDLDDPDGPAHLSIEVDSALTISPGGTLPMDVLLRNHGSTDVEGPHTVSLLVPDGLPAGQIVDVEPGASAWSCIETALVGVREIRCTTEGTIEAGARSAKLPLTLTGTELATGSTLDLTFGHDLDGTPVSQVTRLMVTAPRMAQFSVSSAQPNPLRPGSEADLTIKGLNVGNAAPTDGLDATIDTPDGVTITAIHSAGWECTGTGTGTATCTTDETPGPGGSMSDLVVSLAAAENLTVHPADVDVVLTTTDPRGTRTFRRGLPLVLQPLEAGELTLERTGLAATTGPNRSVDYQIAVTNAGRSAVTGDLRITETLPVGSVVAGGDGGWSCTTTGTMLDCIRSGVTLAAGATAPPLDVFADLPAGLAGGHAQITGAASLSGFSGLSADAVAVAAATTYAPEVQVSLDGLPRGLQRGAGGQLTLGVVNSGNAASPGPTVIGLVFSRGLHPTVADGTGWSCVIDDTASQAALVCRHPDAVQAESALPEVQVAFDVADSAGNQAVLTGGLVGATPGAALADTLATLVGQGTAALTDPGTDVRPVRGVTADAGPDQTVPERTPQDDGTVATEVRLDGRGSTAGLSETTWQWVQTDGPRVDWIDEFVTVVGADGVERPAGVGASPSFRVPRLADSTSVDLQFELTMATADGISRTDTTTVSVTPSPDAGPVMQTITTDLDDIGVAPEPGSPVGLSTQLVDPEGDPVTVRWEIASTDGSLATATIAGDDQVIGAAGGTATASLAWPDHATYVVVEATGTSGRGGVTTTGLVLGEAPPPPSVSVSGPTEVASGAAVTVTADLTVGDPDEVIWRWHQESGPALDPAALNAATGPRFTFDAPSVATNGEVIVLSAIATRVAGAATQVAPGTISVRLAPLGAPDIGITGAGSTTVGNPATWSVTGAPAGSKIRWTQTSGPAGVLASPTAASTTFVGAFDGVVGLEVTVTDPTGRTTSATRELTVGAPFVPSGAAACDAAGSVLNQLFARVASGGLFSATIGPANVTLGSLSVREPCGAAEPSVAFADSTVSIAKGTLTGTGLSGTVSAAGLCLTGGTLRFPESWGLQPAVLGGTDPLCLDTRAGQARPLRGSVTVRGLPLIGLPPGVAEPVTTVRFDGDTIGLRTDAALPNGGTLALNGTMHATTGDLDARVTGQVSLLGTRVTVAGSVTRDASGITWAITGQAPGPITLVAGATLADATVRVDGDGFTVDGTVTVAGEVPMAAKGRYGDADHWSFALAGRAGTDWTPMSGVRVPTADFSGRVGRDGGPVSFDVTAALAQEWTPVAGLRIGSLQARLSNEQAPASCPGVATGAVWLGLNGTAEATFGPAVVAVDGKGCIVPSSDAWSFTSTATMNSWKPLPGADVSVESVGLHAVDHGDGRDVELTAFGSARAMGANLAAVASVVDGSVVVDAMGDLSDLRSGVTLPATAAGHVLFADTVRRGYRFYRAAAIPQIDPALAAVTVPDGVSVYVSTSLDDGVRRFIRDRLSLPDVSSLVLSVHLGAAVPTFTGTLSLGPPGSGYTVYQDCGGATCTADTRSRLALVDLSLTMSATGTIGLAANADLEMAKTDQTPASKVSMVAEITLDLAGPSMVVALYTTDGTWRDALGKAGLDLSELVVQAGVNFATAIPTPSVGVGATIERLPADWASTVGMSRTSSEKMHFGLNLSVTSPIIDLQIGEPDGNVVMDPLRSIRPGLIEIDYASLVIAPFGGKLGAKTYEPGLSLGFAASIAGIDFDAALAVNPLRGSIKGAFAAGPMSYAGFTIRDVTFAFDLDPLNTAKPFSYLIQGAFDLPSLGSGPASAAGRIEITASSSGLRGAVDLSATNIGLAGVARLKTLELSGSAAIGLGGLSALNLDLLAQAELLGADVGVAGQLKVSNNRLVSLSAAASLQAAIGPITLGGPGCGGPLGNSGACVKFAYGSNKIAASIDATLKVSGFDVTVSGELSDAYVRASGSIDIAGVGRLALSGSLYYGTNPQLAGITEKDLSGVSRQVRQGDFRFAAAVATSKLGGFSLSAGATVLRLNNTTGVEVAGKVTVPGGQVQGKGNFRLNGTTLLYDFHASGGLTIDGHRIASVNVDFVKTSGSTRASVAAAASLPLGVANLNASLNGSFSAGSSGLRYDLTGTAKVNVAGMNLDTSLQFSNSRFAFRIYLGAETIFDVTVEGSLSSNGNFSASGTARLGPLGATVEVARSGPNWNFTAQLKYDRHVLAWASFGKGSFTAGIDLATDLSGSATFLALRVGGRFSGSMHLSVTVAKSGGSYSISPRFSGSVRISAWSQVHTLLWGWSDKLHLGSLGASVKPNGDVCAEIAYKEFCL